MVRDGNDGRSGRRSEDNVADSGSQDGYPDGLETTPVCIRDVRAEEGHYVDPELVEGSQPGGCLLAHTKCTGLSISSAWVESLAGGRAGVWLLNEVDKNLVASTS